MYIYMYIVYIFRYVGGIAALGAGLSGQDAWGVGPAGESFGIARLRVGAASRLPSPKGLLMWDFF